MRMHVIDWVIVAIPLAIVFWISFYTRRYMKSVADFLAAGRSAGRFLVATSLGAASYGAITAVMNFEMMCRAGMTLTWWETVLGQFGPVGLFLALSGFVIYRYRETRVLTLAQFFEVRYSRRFRVMAGCLCFISGLINYAIFPAVAARFFVNYIGLPQTVPLLGFAFPTFGLVMMVLLGIALYLTLMGGQLTVMVSDATEGLISGIFYLIVAFAVLSLFNWDQMFTALSSGGHVIGLLNAEGTPIFDVPKGSTGNWLVDPFDSPGSIQDFNIWYVLIGACWLIYGYMAWQGNQAFNCSAANPHEAKMGNILGNWRVFARTVMITLLALCAMTLLRSPDFANEAQSVLADVSKIDQPQIRSQMLVPVTLGHLLPIGIKGCFAAIMLFAMLACDGSYLHSWGSIFIQDVIMPFRKKPFAPGQHIRLLRWSITGVALFAFFFSLLFQQTEAIRLFFDITGAIFMGGAGACIIGGLYWKRGTHAGAWGAMLAGSIVPVLGIVVQQMIAGADTPEAKAFWTRFITLPWGHVMNGREIMFLSMLVAIGLYIVLSILTCRVPHNMDKLLHRGPYEIRDDAMAVVQDPSQRSWVSKLLGWDRHFTRGDKTVSGSLFGWSMLVLAVFVIGTVMNLSGARWSLAWWSTYWWVYAIVLPLVIGVITTVWFTWGVIRDMRRLFTALKTVRRDAGDDGMVNRSAE
jgi:solute:Na+ symporter, SSS family